MHTIFPPIEVAWSALYEALPTSSPSPPKCDCKVQGYLESLGVTWQDADSDNQFSPGVTVPLEEVLFVVRIPEVCQDVIMLNAAQVLLPPSRVYSGKGASSKLSCEVSEEDIDTGRRVSGDEFREGFNLGDCVEAAISIRDEFPDMTRCKAEIFLQGELVDVVDETTFHFRHSHTGKTHLVHRDKLRSVSVPARSLEDCLYNPEGSYITMAKIAVPNELSEWAATPSLSGDFFCNKLWERAGTILATVHETTHQENGTPNNSNYSVLVYGAIESVEHAKLIISNQIKSLLDAATFQERRSRRLKLLEDRRGGQDSSERIEFFVHESLVGLVIGKQGENLARVARNYKVEVRVFPDENGVRRLRIYGSDPIKLDRAKAELEYHFLELPLPDKHAERFLEWLLSDKSLLRDSCNRHALHSLWYHAERQSLIICGLRRSIEDFIRTLDISYKEAHRTPTPPFKQTGFRSHTSPTTAAVSSTVGRNQSTRSQTPVLSPPMACPRPPILDALPSFQKSSQPVVKSANKASAPVLREFPLSLGAPTATTNNGSPSYAQHMKREPSEVNLYSGEMRSPSGRRGVRTSPLIRPDKITTNFEIMGSNSAAPTRPNTSWWTADSRNELGQRSLTRYRRSPKMAPSCETDMSSASGWNMSSAGPSSQPRYPSHQMMPSNHHMPNGGESYYYCQPTNMSLYPCPEVQQQMSPSTPQLYYNSMNPYDMQPPPEYAPPRKFAPSVGSRNGMGYQQQVPPDLRNMQSSVMASGAYYWL